MLKKQFNQNSGGAGGASVENLWATLDIPGKTGLYRGKVREVYTLKNEILVMVVTDNISAFDVVLPKSIPYKGQVLNQIAVNTMKATEDIVGNSLLGVPHPRVSVHKLCTPYKVEMVIRGYLSGHAWREYKAGKRMICGVEMPEGMKENDKFPKPIITPTTKAAVGHDEDISKEDILESELVNAFDYEKLERYTYALFDRGTELAARRGLILVDTKYEFGTDSEGNILLIDEIHTPDSSRYFYADGYEERQKKGEAQKQLSKEFVREWLIERGFQGKESQQVPDMTEIIDPTSGRYIELYEKLFGRTFMRNNDSPEIVTSDIRVFLKSLPSKKKEEVKN